MKLRNRLLIRCLSVFALLIGLLGALLIACSFAFQMAREEEALCARADGLVRGMEAAAVNYALQNIPLTDDLAIAIATQADDSLCLYNASGVLLYGSAPNLPVGKGLIREGQTLYLIRSVSLGERSFRLIVPDNLTPIYENRRALLSVFSLGYGAILALSALVLWRLGCTLTRPLERLADTSLRLRKGDLDARAQPAGDAETVALAVSFNAMADALTGQIERQKRFIAHFTHELKTPLAAMIGHADLIRSGRVRDEEAMLSAQQIFREGKRLNDLTMRLMELILLERETPPMQLVPLLPLFEELRESFLPEAERRGADIALSCADCLVEADLPLLRALLMNLMDNALKSEAKHLTLRGKLAGDRLTLTLADDGRGMDEETLLHLTEPFYRADKARSRAQGGAGLGLALCDRIARLHGSTLRFESTPGQGTAVHLTLSGKELTSHAEA